MRFSAGQSAGGPGAPRRSNFWLGAGAGLVALVAALIWLMPASPSLGSPNPPQRRVTKSKGTSPRRAVVNFTDLARRESAAPRRPRERKVAPFMRPPIGGRAFTRPTPTAEATAAPRLLPLTPLPLSPAPAQSFAALADDESSIPPDTQGTAGPSHLMVTLNSEVRIQNKSDGTEASTVTLDDFWTSTGATGTFDPKVAYDHMSGRWIFVAMSDKRDAASSLLIATSDTNDPTGTWDLYRVDADDTDTIWADYPSLGYNKNWITVTFNAFAVADDAFVQSNIYAFEKTDLYAGTAATHTLFTDVGASTSCPAITYDSDLDTQYLVQTLAGNVEGLGFLEISEITPGETEPAYEFGTANPTTIDTWDDTPPAPGDQDFAPQSGSSGKIQTNDSRMLSLTYRNGSLWAAHTVFLPAGGSPTRSAVQWWEFHPDGAVQQFGRIDDPTATIFRAFPSLAVNSQSDVLIGYSSFSASIFPSGAYSFRSGTDTASTLQSEVILKAGEAKYDKDFGTGRNRWGDYSNTVVDPSNDLDMWTIQEYAETPTGADDLWGTWWGKIAPTPAVVKKRTGQMISD